MGHKVSGMGERRGDRMGRGDQDGGFSFEFGPPTTATPQRCIIYHSGFDPRTDLHVSSDRGLKIRCVSRRLGHMIYANKFRPPVICYQDFLFLSQTIVAVNG